MFGFERVDHVCEVGVVIVQEGNEALDYCGALLKEERGTVCRRYSKEKE